MTGALRRLPLVAAGLVRALIRRPDARMLAVGSSAILGLAIVLLPWYRLGTYEPNGWDATVWARVALVLVLVNLALVRSGRGGRLPLALAALAFALVALRVALPPDFGFDFDGLDVPVERRFGAWVGLGAAGVALAAFAIRALRPPRASDASSGSGASGGSDVLGGAGVSGGSGARRWRGPGW